MAILYHGFLDLTALKKDMFVLSLLKPNKSKRLKMTCDCLNYYK